MNTERFTSAVQLVDIGTGLHQHAGNLHTGLGVVLLPGRNVEQGLLPIATRTLGHLDADTGFQGHADPLHVTLANEVQQRDLADILRNADHGAGGSDLRRHAATLQMALQLRVVRIPAQRPAIHAGLEVRLAELQQKHTHLVVAGLAAHLTERNRCHHAVAAPGGHGSIRISALFQQHTRHADTGGRGARTHEAHQQPQRGIAHIAQLLPITRACVNGHSSRHQRTE